MHPARDDKVLTSWNALAVSALVHASRDLGEPGMLAAARRVASLLVEKHVAGSRVWHVSRDGKAKIDGFLEDYAFLARALLDLSEAAKDPEMASRARSIAEEMVAGFSDSAAGGFFQTAAAGLRRAEAATAAQAGKRGLLDSSKEFLDQVVPSPNGVAVEVLRRLEATRDSPEIRLAADRTMSAAASYARAFPTSATTFAILAAARPSSPAKLASEAQSGPVRVSVGRPPDGVLPGGDSRLTVHLEVERGWHIQSHRPSRPDLVATDVRAAGDSIAFGNPDYPPGMEASVAGETLSTYSGVLEIAVPIAISRDARAGELRAEFTIDFQACDDRRCLSPSRLEVAVPVPVSAPKPAR